MSEFSVFTLPQGAIQYLYSMREQIWLDPPYQRMSDIWTMDKRQLLVDSVINGFDIPKLYFHELVPARKAGGHFQKYAIVDGKQRLETLWSFIDGHFSLADDFEYLHDKSLSLAGLTYNEIGKRYPLIKSRFDGTSLAVIAIRTDDTELIEEMFSRLNEAVPLNAPEKRNAFGGPLPQVIRGLASHPLFVETLPFSDRRYRHRDLAAKFLLIEYSDIVTDTKKAYLDQFVREWKLGTRKAQALRTRTEVHLARMARVFGNQDPLLRSIGMVLLVFHFFRLLDTLGKVSKITRQHFELFETARQANRLQAELDITKARYDLLEFDKYVQTPNDAFATRIRLSILVGFLRDEGILDLPKTHPYFEV